VAWARPASPGLTCIECHNLVDTIGNTGGQYINVFSGDLLPGNTNGYLSMNLHTLHINEVTSNLQCIDCHDTAKLATLHFTNIMTGNTKTLIPGVAAGTVGGGTTKITTYTYPGTAGRKSDCTVNGSGCHTTQIRSWFQ
jgi:hypothetical protein